MFENQPKGLYVLALANTGERFGYYTMLAILLLFLQAKFGFSTATAGFIYSTFLALVYFMPMIGGWIADKWNFTKTVTLGIIVMFLGYLVMAIPTPAHSNISIAIMVFALFLISCGTGLFKGNLQVMVGDLYDNPRYSSQRDVAFSLFYMAINIGAMFAPSITEYLCNLALNSEGFTYSAALPSLCNGYVYDIASMTPASIAQLQALANAQVGTAVTDLAAFCNNYINAISTGYSYAFAVACGSMVLSFIIYKLGRKAYTVSDKEAKEIAAAEQHHPELSKDQTKSRITALMLVFAVVIFFWMVFHQNGATLTKFAQIFTEQSSTGWTRIGFNVWALAVIVIGVYSTFSIFQSKSARGKVVSSIVTLGVIVGLYFIYHFTPDTVTDIQPQKYQQFNPFYVVALTPFSVALFAWLAKKKKEPSAPRKIGYGMLVAGVAYIIMIIGSMNLGVPPMQGTSDTLVSPNWLISTYLVLTFAELLLSPMGISFVSKVAPPKYKGMMMGCWFGATAIGNYLVSIPTLLWDKLPLPMLWGILVVLCLLSALFIFSVMKRLEKVA